MNSYDIFFIIMGIALIAASFLPRFLERSIISPPMVYVTIGIIISLIWKDLPKISPFENGKFLEHTTEFAVILSLMGAGLKIDREFGFKSWNTVWRLLIITMPLSILAVTAIGYWYLSLPFYAALLLAGSLAPTDPVLASSVQVGSPGEEKEHEVRFGLTGEAGLNDGLAFPFIYLAVALGTYGATQEVLIDWLRVDVFWKIFAGTSVGIGIGWLIAFFFFRINKSYKLENGFVAVAVMMLAYGATELANGYGFIGVFVAALAFRRFEKNHDYHKRLNDFTIQIESLFMVFLLLLFGVMIGQGLYKYFSFEIILLATAIIFVIRPIAGMLAFTGSKVSMQSRIIISLLGIRGLGSFYYLAYGIGHLDMNKAFAEKLWAICGLIVILSIIIHGVSAPYLVSVAEKESD